MAVDRTVRRSTSPGGSAPLREEELENYGVWVKSEPVDLVEGSSSEPSEDEDAFSPEIPDIKEETFLTEEEESLLGEVDSGDALRPGPSDGVEVDFSADELAVSRPDDETEFETLEEAPPLPSEGTDEDAGSFMVPLGDLDEFSVPEPEELPDIELLSASRAGALDSADQEDASLEELLPEDEASPVPPLESGDEAVSLEDFGMSDDAPPAPRGKGAAPSSGGDEEVSLDDFLDDSSFGQAAAQEAVLQEALSQEPIDLDLEFDDEAEFETLSISKDVDEDFIEAKAPAREPEKEEERPVRESTVETEEVTDFDDLLSGDGSGPSALQFSSERSGGIDLDIDTGLVEAGIVEDAGIEDQTALVADAGSDDLGIDVDEEARDEGPVAARYEASKETEDILADVDFSEAIPYDAPSGDVPDYRDAPDFRDDSGGVEPSFGAGLEPLSGADSFDDLAAVESELAFEIADEEDDVAKSREGGEVSATLLHQIAGELSDIKRELSSLKDQLSAIRRDAPSARAPAAKAPAAEDSSKVPGFFEDEDEEDETIALTGDELDNILNTAQFSEETGASEEDAASAAAAQEDALEDIIPLEEKAPSPAKAREEDDKGFSDLMAIEEEGLSPMTEAPEDTSYLEEPLKEELEGAVLPEMPLEEPDLSDFLVDEEPAEEEVPVIDGGDLLVELPGEAEGELEDITLDLNPDASIAPEGLPEAPPVQRMAEPEMPARTAKESPEALKGDIKNVLQYMDRLLESLPEEKIEEFARSDHFAVYKRLFEELGLV